jgi:hypothetical protein
MTAALADRAMLRGRTLAALRAEPCRRGRAVAAATARELDVDQPLELAVDGLADELLELRTVRCDKLGDSLVDPVHDASLRRGRAAIRTPGRLPRGPGPQASVERQRRLDKMAETDASA